MKQKENKMTTIERPGKMKYVHAPEQISNTYETRDEKGKIEYEGRLIHFKYINEYFLMACYTLLKRRLSKKKLSGISGRFTLWPKISLKLECSYADKETSEIVWRGQCGAHVGWSGHGDDYFRYPLVYDGKFKIEDIVETFMKYGNWDDDFRYKERVKDVTPELLKKVFGPLEKQVLETFPTKGNN